MRNVTKVLMLFLAAGPLGCGGCDDSVDPADNARINDASTPFEDGDTGEAGGDAGGNNWVADAGSDAEAPDIGSDAGSDAGQTGPDGGGDAGSSQCGDGVVDAAEACDDGGTADGDYCSADCRNVTGSCGDGTVQANEACDDGGTAAGDYCSADCRNVTGSCGDGTLQANETCDDGATANCAGTNDGGAGVCVPAGTCSAGYTWNGSSCVTTNNTGLSVPCQNGSGYTMFRFHYSNNSTSAQLDVWDASCSYSFAPGSACNVYEICPGFCDPPVTSEGYPIFNTSNYLRVRFSANGLNFNQATLYVQARSYATSSSTNFRAWSPLYGDAYGGPVDNDFVYDWYAVDWSNHLSPFDDPSYTAIQIYGANGSLAVKAVELCVE